MFFARHDLFEADVGEEYCPSRSDSAEPTIGSGLACEVANDRLTCVLCLLFSALVTVSQHFGVRLSQLPTWLPNILCSNDKTNRDRNA